MSLANVEPYFATRMKALSYSQHDNPRFDNVPENKLHKAFHVELGDSVGPKEKNQRSLEVLCPVVVRAYFKGSNNESARSRAVSGFDEILVDLLNPVNRLNISGVKDITFTGSTRSSVSESNSRDVVLEMNFSALVIYGT